MVRFFLFLSLAVVLMPDAASAAAKQSVTLDVFLGKHSHIGEHHYDIEPLAKNGYKVRSRCRFDVNILFFSAYSYNHHTEEVWQDGCLKKVESKTTENGETTHVKGQLEDGVFQWQINGGPVQTTQKCVRTFAYWHPTYLMDTPELMNPQTGKIQEVTVRAEDVSGQATSLTDPGKKIHLAGDELDIKVWYTEAMKWLGLTSEVDGNQLRYKRTDNRDASYEDLF